MRTKTTLIGLGISLVFGLCEYTDAADAPVWKINLDNKQIKALAWSPDESQIGVQFESNSETRPRQWGLELRNASDGALLRKLAEIPHNNFVKSDVAFAPDGHSIASAIWRKTGKVGPTDLSLPPTGIVATWDASEGKFLSELQGAPQEGLGLPFSTDFLSCTYSPDGTMLAAVGKLVGQYPIAGSHIGGEIAVWDVKQNQLLWNNRDVHANIVYAVAFSPDGLTIASGGIDSPIRLWDARTGKLKKTLHGAAWDGVQSLMFSRNGKLLASAGSGKEEGKRIEVWDVSSGMLAQSIGIDDFNTQQIAFVSNSSKLLVLGNIVKNDSFSWQVVTCDASGKPTARTIDANQRRVLSDGSGYAKTMSVSASGKAFVVGLETGDVLLFKLED